MYHDFFYIFDECVNFGLWGIYYNKVYSPQGYHFG